MPLCIHAGVSETFFSSFRPLVESAYQNNYLISQPKHMLKVMGKITLKIFILTYECPLVKSAYQKNNFLISQPKHMLWVLKRTVSFRHFF